MRKQNRKSAPKRHLVAQYWAEREPGFVLDLGEPGCFACGYFSESWEPVYREGGYLDIAATWKQARLDTAHLTPHMLAGTSDVSNLVLLCPACHRDAPSYRDPGVMLRWMRERPSYVDQQLDALPYDRLSELALVPGLAEKLAGDAFRAFLHANAGYNPADTHTAKARTVWAAVEAFATQRKRRTVLVRGL